MYIATSLFFAADRPDRAGDDAAPAAGAGQHADAAGDLRPAALRLRRHRAAPLRAAAGDRTDLAASCRCRSAPAASRCRACTTSPTGSTCSAAISIYLQLPLPPLGGRHDRPAAALRRRVPRPAARSTPGSSASPWSCVGFVLFAISMIATVRSVAGAGDGLAPGAAVRLGRRRSSATRCWSSARSCSRRSRC